MRSLHCPLLIAALVGFSLLSPAALASQFGRQGFSGNPDTNGGADCAACHAPGAVVPLLSLSGPSLVDANTTHVFTATLTGGPGVTGGVGISASDDLGSFAPLGGDLALAGDEISHSMPKAFASGSVSFQFEWTAPSFDTDVTLFAAGNSTDGSVDLIGDAVDTDQLVVTVQNGGPPPPPDPPPAPSTITLETFAEGLNRPVVIQSAGDSRLFVVEQPGLIRIVDSDGTVRTNPFLNIQLAVDSSTSEQGLLGLAFHPDYATNGEFFVYYTVDPGAGLDRSRVSRFSVSANPDIADPFSEVVLLEFEQTDWNHNGGDIHFGPDGYLYIASGDGGGGGDPFGAGQDTGVLLGKILRIDVDGGVLAPDCDLSGSTAYGIPFDNAYTDGPGGAGCDEIWALGVRNPWRMSFDRVTGDLWIADVGQGAWEEVNLLADGSAAGLNLGWRCYEGNAFYNPSGCSASGYLFPIHAESHLDGDCSITGGYVYRGSEEPGLTGRYFYADFCNTAIRTITQDGSGWIVDEAIPAGAISQPATFGEDHNGELYVASLGGRIYRIREVPPPELPGPAPLIVAVALGALGLVAVARK